MIDGFSKYNQVVVHPDDMENISFMTPWGTFMYTRMPFGLNKCRGYISESHGYSLHGRKG